MKNTLDNIDLDHIRKTHWYRQGGAGAPYYFYTPFCGGMLLWGRGNLIIQQEGTMHHGFFDKDAEYKKATEDIGAQKKNNSYIDSLIGDWTKTKEEMDEYLSRVQFDTLPGLSDSELLKKYEKMHDYDLELWKISVHIEVFDPWADEIIGKTAREYNLSLNKAEVDELVSPDNFLYSQEEELYLCKIYLAETGQGEKLEAHQQKYFWLDNDWVNIKVLGLEYFAEKLEKMSELGRLQVESRVGEMERMPEEKRKRKQEIVAKYSIPTEAQNIFYFFSRMTKWRDDRKKAVLIYNNYYRLFAEEFSRRTRVPFEHIIFAMPQEIVDSGLKFSKEFVGHLKARSENSVYYIEKSGHPVALINDEYRAFMEILDEAFRKQFKELKGAPASKGKATGKAKIINVPADFGKMQVGDILVAPMTRPEYLPLMKMAAAIVTDEGGVTCHAAIVSRELGIPCVIGTQVATEMLEDGEEVEVDADSGVVKKI